MKNESCCVGNFSVATSARPDGGFTTIRQGPDDAAQGLRCGNMNEDFNVFAEEDGSAAYLVVRHEGFFCIERLDESFRGGLGARSRVAHVPTQSILQPGGVPGDEAPILFRRGQLYYLLMGSGCCDCKGGATTWVFSAADPLGPWTRQARNVGVGADGWPVTKAQQRDVLRVDGAGAGAEPTYLWVGNNFIPGSGGPGTHINGGLLYWSPLAFLANGTIEQMAYSETADFPLPSPRPQA